MYTVPRVNVYKNVYTPSQGSQLGKWQFVYNPRVKRIRRFAAHTRATATACRSGPRNAESRGKVYTNPRARNLWLRRVVYSPPCERIQKRIHPIFNEFGYNPRSRQKTYTFARVNVYVSRACPTRFAFCVEPAQPRFRLAENRNIDRKCRTPLSCNATEISRIMVGIRSRGRSGEDSAALCTVVNPRPETPLVSGGFSMVLRAARHAAGAPSGALRHGQAVVSAHVGGGPVPAFGTRDAVRRPEP